MALRSTPDSFPRQGERGWRNDSPISIGRPLDNLTAGKGKWWEKRETASSMALEEKNLRDLLAIVTQAGGASR